MIPIRARLAPPVLVLVTAILGSSGPGAAQLAPEDLTGLWVAHGYSCEGPTPPQLVEITVEERLEDGATVQEVVATKVLGDACVPAGVVTWRGQIEGGRIVGNTWVISGAPPAEPYPTYDIIYIHGPDYLEGIVAPDFRRVTRAAPPDADSCEDLVAQLDLDLLRGSFAGFQAPADGYPGSEVLGTPDAALDTRMVSYAREALAASGAEPDDAAAGAAITLGRSLVANGGVPPAMRSLAAEVDAVVETMLTDIAACRLDGLDTRFAQLSQLTDDIDTYRRRVQRHLILANTVREYAGITIDVAVEPTTYGVFDTLYSLFDARVSSGTWNPYNADNSDRGAGSVFDGLDTASIFSAATDAGLLSFRAAEALGSGPAMAYVLDTAIRGIAPSAAIAINAPANPGGRFVADTSRLSGATRALGVVALIDYAATTFNVMREFSETAEARYRDLPELTRWLEVQVRLAAYVDLAKALSDTTTRAQITLQRMVADLPR